MAVIPRATGWAEKGTEASLQQGEMRASTKIGIAADVVIPIVLLTVWFVGFWFLRRRRARQLIVSHDAGVYPVESHSDCVPAEHCKAPLTPEQVLRMDKTSLLRDVIAPHCENCLFYLVICADSDLVGQRLLNLPNEDAMASLLMQEPRPFRNQTASRLSPASDMC
jgi:hypothetical protein